MTNASQKIHSLLVNKLSPSYVRVEDLSHLHAGHQGAQESGGGHFSLMVAAEIFKGKRPLECHRLIYHALAEMKYEIHALAIQAYASIDDIPKSVPS